MSKYRRTSGYWERIHRNRLAKIDRAIAALDDKEIKIY